MSETLKEFLKIEVVILAIGIIGLVLSLLYGNVKAYLATIGTVQLIVIATFLLSIALEPIMEYINKL